MERRARKELYVHAYNYNKTKHSNKLRNLVYVSFSKNGLLSLDKSMNGFVNSQKIKNVFAKHGQKP